MSMMRLRLVIGTFAVVMAFIMAFCSHQAQASGEDSTDKPIAVKEEVQTQDEKAGDPTDEEDSVLGKTKGWFSQKLKGFTSWLGQYIEIKVPQRMCGDIPCREVEKAIGEKEKEKEETPPEAKPRKVQVKKD